MIAPRAVVFDLDGTLLDSRGDIIAAMNHALAHTGRAPLPASTLLRFTGDGALTLCARAIGAAENDEAVADVLDAYLEYYLAHPLVHSRWMAHGREVLEELDGFALALCTNKPRSATDRILAGLGVTSRFASVVAGGDVPEKKPSPGPLLAVADALRVSPEELIMVGDGPQDIEAGKRAGTRTIGVLGGFPSRERLVAARPDVVLDGLHELAAVAKRWKAATVRAIR